MTVGVHRQIHSAFIGGEKFDADVLYLMLARGGF
jgi:hypothetical protein